MHNYNLILTLFGSKKCKFTKFHFRHRNRQHRLMSPINIWVKKLIFIFKYNQQDATLLNGIYYYKCSTCFRRFLRPSSGAQNCIHSIGYLSSFFCFLPLSWVGCSKRSRSFFEIGNEISVLHSLLPITIALYNFVNSSIGYICLTW